LDVCRQLRTRTNCFSLETEEEKANWLRKPVYVVGASTAAAVAELGFNTVGQDSGKAERLSDLIISENATVRGRSMLFLTGDKRGDTIFQRLAEHGIEVTEVSVYATRPVSNFPSLLAEEAASAGSPCWVAFFSPSGVDIALKPCQDSSWWSADIRIASIGPTTSAKLDKLQIRVDAEAKQPGPESLADAVKESDDRPSK